MLIVQGEIKSNIRQAFKATKHFQFVLSRKLVTSSVAFLFALFYLRRKEIILDE